MPGFLFLASNIMEHAQLAWNSAPVSPLPGVLPAVPSLLLYLACNVATQYVCISAVFTLTSECASLTVTLVVTLRKFLSLLFSIWYFSNPFTAYHWLGTALVFSGTLLFSDVHGMVMQKLRPTAEEAKKDK